MPGRRGITIVVGALGAAALAVVGAILFLRGERDVEHGAHNAATSRAVDSREEGGEAAASTPAALDGARSMDAPPSLHEGGGDVGAQRDVESQPEVTFSGLVHVDGLTEEEARLGTLVLRGVESDGASARIELPIRRGRFSGRGPAGATVAVERLTFGERTVTTRAERWKLASRWLQVYGTLATPRLLHVVDESGHELTHVYFLEAEHTEGAPAGRGDRIEAVGVEVVEGPGPPDPAAGFASPFRVAAIHSASRPSWITTGDSDAPTSVASPPEALECVVRVPQRGVEFVRFAESELEKRVVMRAPATVRVHVAPWPSAAPAGGGASPAQPPSVFLALLAPEEPDRDEPPSMPGAKLTPAMRARIDAAKEQRRFIERAVNSPLRHVAAVDASGTATFSDVAAGEWVAWCSGDAAADVAVHGNRVVGRARDAARRTELTRLSTQVGGASDVTVRAESREPSVCAVAVHANSAADGAPVEIGVDEVEITALEATDPFVEAAISMRHWRSLDRRISNVINDDSDVTAPVGLAWIVVTPDTALGFAPASTLVDLVPGRNEVAVTLPPTQGVLVELHLEKPTVLQMKVAWSRMARLRLGQCGKELGPQIENIETDEGTSGVLAAFVPIAPGRCELIVPDDAGFDRPGVTTIEVGEHRLAKIELHCTIPKQADDAERR